MSLLGCVTAAADGTADAAPFANGDFEQPAVDSQFHEFDATRNAPAGWTAAGAGGCVFDARWLGAYGNPDAAAANGWQFVDLQRGGQLGSISQTFDTVPGQTYRVAFDLSAITCDPDGAPPQTFTLAATAAGVAQPFSVTAGGHAFGGNGLGTDPWTPEAFTFTAAAASSTLTLANLTPYAGGLDDGTAIDAVTVTPLADDPPPPPPAPADVPEPAPTLLFAVAAAGAVLRRSRRNAGPRRGTASPRPTGIGRPGRAAATAVSGLLAASGVAAAAPFTNGDFEQPPIAGAFQGFDAAGNAPVGWTAAGGAGYLWNVPRLHAGNYPNAGAASGSQFVDLQRSGELGSIGQTFDTTPGTTYLVGFDLSAMTYYHNGANPPQTFTLAATAPGAAQQFSITTAGTAFGGYGMGTDPWTSESFSFTATDTSSTLTLANETVYGGDLNYGTAVDDVSVVALPPGPAVGPVDAPEPAPALLIGASAACLLLARPRRRTTG